MRSSASPAAPQYPGAAETVAAWRELDGCAAGRRHRGTAAGSGRRPGRAGDHRDGLRRRLPRRQPGRALDHPGRLATSPRLPEASRRPWSTSCTGACRPSGTVDEVAQVTAAVEVGEEVDPDLARRPGQRHATPAPVRRRPRARRPPPRERRRSPGRRADPSRTTGRPRAGPVPSHRSMPSSAATMRGLAHRAVLVRAVTGRRQQPVRPPPGEVIQGRRGERVGRLLHGGVVVGVARPVGPGEQVVLAAARTAAAVKAEDRRGNPHRRTVDQRPDRPQLRGSLRWILEAARPWAGGGPRSHAGAH